MALLSSVNADHSGGSLKRPNCRPGSSRFIGLKPKERARAYAHGWGHPRGGFRSDSHDVTPRFPKRMVYTRGTGKKVELPPCGRSRDLTEDIHSSRIDSLRAYAAPMSLCLFQVRKKGNKCFQGPQTFCSGSPVDLAEANIQVRSSGSLGRGAQPLNIATHVAIF